MCSIKQIKELAERNAVYEFEKTVNGYGKEYIRYYYNKLAELNGSINSACSCKHNSNSRDNEPCCRCDSKHTNADRIRNMSDEELAEWINTKDACGQCAYELESLCMEEPCTNGILKWLQSEVKVEESEEK